MSRLGAWVVRIFHHDPSQNSWEVSGKQKEQDAETITGKMANTGQLTWLCAEMWISNTFFPIPGSPQQGTNGFRGFTEKEQSTSTPVAALPSSLKW